MDLFTRQLGAESGVQLNPLRDNSEIPVGDNYDQLFGAIIRATRGRIDKPFKVNKSNVANKLGFGESIRANALNEGYAQVVEALNNGAYEAVIQRLVNTETAVTRYAVVKLGQGFEADVITMDEAGTIGAITIANPGLGYKTGQKITFTDSTGSGAVATIEASNSALQAVDIVAGGAGYSAGDEVYLSAKTGDNAIATVGTVSAGAITVLNITNGGSGYELNDSVKFIPLKGSNAKVTITVAAGVITTATTVAGSRGTGYKVGQKVRPPATNQGSAVQPTNDGNAVLTVASVNGSGGITGLTVTSGGTNYRAMSGVAATSIVGSGGTGTATEISSDGEVTAINISNGGTGYSNSVTAEIKNTISFSTSKSIPAGAFLFALKHFDCFNDGIKIEFNAAEKKIGNTVAENDKITVRLKDSYGNLLHEFYGSLNPDSVDEYGNSSYLPDVVSAQTDSVQMITDVILSILPDNEDIYGYANWKESGTLICFDEGESTYIADDYLSARTKLENSLYDFGYISAAGSKSTLMLNQLIQLAYNTNRPLAFDVAGTLTPDSAVTFVNNLNISGNIDKAHLVNAFWSPLKAQDSVGINGKSVIGVASLNIAYACGRNAQTNAKGFAPKNYPIAGKNFPISRSNITQIYTPTDQEFNALAVAKINPVVFETYTGGGRYVFKDSLTCAPVENSLKKLMSVVDMSTSVDHAVAKFGKDVLQFPMDVAVKKMKDFLKRYFEGAQTSGWLVPSTDPFMKGAAFLFEVKPNEVRPYDRMDVNYWCHYDGAVRQIFVTQTLAR